MVQTGRGLELMEAIRRVITAMKVKEAARLAERQRYVSPSPYEGEGVRG